MKICIDAGHGGKDPGAVLGNRYEKTDTLRLAKRIGKVLRANGIEVCYTRTQDVYNSPGEKARLGNTHKADLFISLHRNAYSSPSSNGVEVLVYSKTSKGYKFAKSVQNQLVSRCSFADRGVKERTDLAVLRLTTMPAMLIEAGFITNKTDNKIFDEKFYTLANAICRGVMESVGLEFKTLTQLSK